MIHKILLSTFGLLTLATCQNQNVSQKTNTSEKTEIVKEPIKTTTGVPANQEEVKQPEAEANSNATKGDVIYLKEGENQFLKQYEMNVTFKGITEDSRCPKGVNCIWSGVATAEIEVMGLATRPMILKISTVKNENRKTTDVQNFNGYSIKLVDLSPEPTTEKGYKALKGSYKVGLKFEKDSAPDKSTTTR